jgi:8-oxo-dGTP pyrophosphatase MutT (NUDIX family)
VRRDFIRHPGSVVVLAVDGNKRTPTVLLERQYRHTMRKVLWELPAGKIDAGETPLHAAKRELLEETGYRARRWRRILQFYVSPGFLDEYMNIFLAEGLRAGEAQPEADEQIAIEFVTLPRALRMAAGGDIQDAKTLTAIFWLELQLQKPTPR